MSPRTKTGAGVVAWAVALGAWLLGPGLDSTRGAAWEPARVVQAARDQIGVTVGYDPAYRRLAYPGGDVPPETGVCSDVVVRAFRAQGLDLQRAVHEDMKRAFAAYPKKWGLTRPDPHIDHRRVPNLMTYFRRQGWSLEVSDPGPKAAPRAEDGAGFAPGDVVAWDLGRGVTHIGIVSDRRTASGIPRILHNIGAGVCEEDLLRRYRILGHYRPASRSGGAPVSPR